MAQDINPQWEEGLHHLQGDLLLAEWNLLLDRLAQFVSVRSLAKDIHAGGEACLLVQCADVHLTELDRLVMACLVIDPLYREEQEGGYFFMATFRNWWRESVPFLMDPDGERRYYRYEVIDGATLPPEER